MRAAPPRCGLRLRAGVSRSCHGLDESLMLGSARPVRLPVAVCAVCMASRFCIIVIFSVSVSLRPRSVPVCAGAGTGCQCGHPGLQAPVPCPHCPACVVGTWHTRGRAPGGWEAGVVAPFPHPTEQERCPSHLWSGWQWEQACCGHAGVQRVLFLLVCVLHACSVPCFAGLCGWHQASHPVGIGAIGASMIPPGTCPGCVLAPAAPAVGVPQPWGQPELVMALPCWWGRLQPCWPLGSKGRRGAHAWGGPVVEMQGAGIGPALRARAHREEGAPPAAPPPHTLPSCIPAFLLSIQHLFNY